MAQQESKRERAKRKKCFFLFFPFHEIHTKPNTIFLPSYSSPNAKCVICRFRTRQSLWLAILESNTFEARERWTHVPLFGHMIHVPRYTKKERKLPTTDKFCCIMVMISEVLLLLPPVDRSCFFVCGPQQHRCGFYCVCVCDYVHTFFSFPHHLDTLAACTEFSEFIIFIVLNFISLNSFLLLIWQATTRTYAQMNFWTHMIPCACERKHFNFQSNQIKSNPIEVSFASDK